MKLASLLGVLALAPLSAAQQFQVLMQEGDALPGGGEAFAFYELAVNDQGQWLIQVDVDPGFGPFRLVGANGVVLEQGQSMAAPANATLNSFGSVEIDEWGRAVCVLDVELNGLEHRDGLYLDDQLLVLSEEPLELAGLESGSTLEVLHQVWMGPQGRASASARWRPAGGGVEQDVILGWDFEAAGASAGELLVSGGHTPQGHVLEVLSLGQAQRSASGGLAVAAGVKMEPLLGADRAVWVNGRIVALENHPSPVPGRLWGNFLHSAYVDVNSAGEWAFVSRLHGDEQSDVLLVKNGQKWVQTGDVLPATAPYPLENLATSSFKPENPVQLTEDGRLLWSAHWDDPAPSAGFGLFLDHEIQVESGVDQIGSHTIGPIFPDTYRISDNGRWLLFQCSLLPPSGPGDRAVILADLDAR